MSGMNSSSHSGFFSSSQSSGTPRSGTMFAGYQNNKSMVPTAKVPNYVNRVRPGVRDAKPGLLPTPNFPPMKPGQCIVGSPNHDWNSIRGQSNLEDVYATPYASKGVLKLPSDLHRMQSNSSVSGFTDYVSLETPTSQTTKVSHTPTSFQAGCCSSSSNLSSNIDSVISTELVESLLSMLSTPIPPSEEGNTAILGSSAQQLNTNNSDELNMQVISSLAGFYMPHPSSNDNGNGF